jgi:hypothetical protein
VANLSPISFLFPDRPFDLAVLDRAQRLGGNLVAVTLGARLLQRWRPQQAADMVGAEWRRGALHRFLPAGTLFLLSVRR